MGGGGDQGGWVDLSSPLESSKFHQEPQEDMELEFVFSLLGLLLLLSYSLYAPILPFCIRIFTMCNYVLGVLIFDSIQGQS